MSDLKPKQNISIEIVSGVEGLCLIINDYRVAGPKPWGGGAVTHSFKAKLADIERAVYGNRRAQPENKPLTIEQLREMDGEPVWVKEITPEPIDGDYWGLVDPDLVCVGGYGVGAVLSTATDGKSRCAQTPFSDYGKTWLAYRRKKEGV